MSEDYRRTKYDPPMIDLKGKKSAVEAMVKKSHPKAIDMHTYISDRKEPFRNEFIKAYDGRCAYCGVSTIVISSDLLEIDHFKYEKGFTTKAEAGFMDNLVLACHSCNHAKRDYTISSDYERMFNPDNDEITDIFVRDEAYYIKIQKKHVDDCEVAKFYERLDLGGEIHRLDYFLMSMNGLREKIGDGHKAAPILDRALNLLHSKRNIGVCRK